MTEQQGAILSQINALKTTDLSPLIRMGGLIAPRMIDAFLPVLNEKQRKAFNKAMPVGGGKKFYVQLVGTPTPPIVMQMGQPLKMNTFSESEIKEQRIKGLKLTTEDVKAALEKKFGKLVWRFLGQAGALVSLSSVALPFIQLGRGEIQDLKTKALVHFQPLFDLMPKR